MLNGYRTPNAAKKLKTALHGPDHRSLRFPAPSRSRRLIRRVLRLSRTPDAPCPLPAKSSFPLPHFVCGSVFCAKQIKCSLLYQTFPASAFRKILPFPAAITASDLHFGLHSFALFFINYTLLESKNFLLVLLRGRTC